MLSAVSLHELDAKLCQLLKLLDGKTEYGSVAARALETIKSVEGKWPDARIRPEVANFYKPHRRQRYTLASGWFEETEYLDQSGVDALLAVFEELIPFTQDENAPAEFEEYAGRLREVCRRYLRRRGYDVSAWAPGGMAKGP